ncbi:MAG TPA: branched-chain amino acid aminotransferase, partial [Stellaceae bacterium]|nr:branched-chain amino acid aminotransferase [Stellaceae bacterium]
KAQEVFLTGTAAEVTPVREIDKYRFTPGTICKMMIEDFETATRCS